MRAIPKSKLRIRQKLGKYRIERRLSDGPFGSVFRAADTIMGVQVALKVPHPGFADQAFQTAFREESAIVSTLDHPGILQIRDATIVEQAAQQRGTHKLPRFVISSPLGLETLAERMSRRMSFETAVVLIDQVLSAVAFAHQRRVIHGGIRPENVILFADGLARIADFGVSRAATETLIRRGRATAQDAAPEQKIGQATARSDVFSLGRVFYFLLTGEWPTSPFEWPMEGIQKLRARFPESTMKWLKKGLELRPSKRFQDARQMRNAFVRIRSEAIRCVETQRMRRIPVSQPTLKLRRAA